MPPYMGESLFSAVIYPPASGYEVVLIKLPLDREIQVDYLELIRQQQNNRPLLINQNGKISIYGFVNGKWKLTELNNEIFCDLQFLAEDQPIINNRDITERMYEEITSKNAHVSFQAAGHFMHTVTVSNLGKTTLKKVQILHSLMIEKGNPNLIGIGISPAYPYSFEDGGTTLIFPSLSPSEAVTITYIYPANVIQSVNFNTIHKFASFFPMVRAEEAVGEPITFIRSFNFPNWLNVAFWILIMIGFWTTTSFLANLFSLVNNYILINSISSSLS
jgi:hypothetical protein